MDMDDIEAQLAALHGEGSDSEEDHASGPPPRAEGEKSGGDVADLDAGAIFGEDSPLKDTSSPKKQSSSKQKSSSGRSCATSSPATAPSSKIVLKLNMSDKKRNEKASKNKSQEPPPSASRGASNSKSHGRRRRSPSERDSMSSPEYARHNFAVSCGLDRQKKAARAGFANAVDDVNRKDQWKCCFCRRGTHFAGLGDLFGPYLVAKKYRSRSGHSELAPGQEIWLHHPCAYWAPGIYIAPTEGLEMPQGLLDFMEDSLSKLCVSCGEVGASVTCVSKSCDRAYHLPCAYAADCDLNEDNLQLFCRVHKNNGDDNGSRSAGSLPSFMDGSVWKMRY